MSESFGSIDEVMSHAVSLARRGLGHVEPNPAVGAVVVDESFHVLGEGWHEHFGGPHAEVMALRQAGDTARGATLCVTLEPCCHQGQTPPCTAAILEAGLGRAVVGLEDPSPHAAGQGLKQLREAEIQVETGVGAAEVRRLNAPFLNLLANRRPWVHAKWAMTVDGRIATSTGESQWISNEASRAVVHELRGGVDAILVGAGTVAADDPLLTARPEGPRVATRIVLDARARLSLDSQLVRTLDQAPLLVACCPEASEDAVERLKTAGVEVLVVPAGVETGRVDLAAVLAELGRRRMTNLLVEGGSEVLGAFADADLIDEAHVFLAAKIIGGRNALGAVGGQGNEQVPTQPTLVPLELRELEGDVYWRGVRGAGESSSDFC